MDKTDKSCIHCEHLGDCPIIVRWVEVTECPMECLTFLCSEYKGLETPK